MLLESAVQHCSALKTSAGVRQPLYLPQSIFAGKHICRRSMHQMSKAMNIRTNSLVFFEEGVCCLASSILGGAMSGSVTTPFFCSGESFFSGPALLQADVKKPRPLGFSPGLRASLPEGAPAPFSCRYRTTCLWTSRPTARKYQ